MGFLGNRHFSRFDENQPFSSFGSLKIDDFLLLLKIVFLFDLQYFHYANVLLCVPYHVSRITFVCIIVCAWLELE